MEEPTWKSGVIYINLYVYNNSIVFLESVVVSNERNLRFTEYPLYVFVSLYHEGS